MKKFLTKHIKYVHTLRISLYFSIPKTLWLLVVVLGCCLCLQLCFAVVFELTSEIVRLETEV